MATPLELAQAAHADSSRLREAADSASDRRNAAIVAALEAGATGAQIAQALGVSSTQRIYQMASKHRQRIARGDTPSPSINTESPAVHAPLTSQTPILIHTPPARGTVGGLLRHHRRINRTAFAEFEQELFDSGRLPYDPANAQANSVFRHIESLTVEDLNRLEGAERIEVATD